MTSPPPEMDELRTVLVTAPDMATGETIARRLVEERLAACGNVIPGITSIYRWEGEVEEAREVLVLIKTTAARMPALMERVVALHPYDVPEVLSLPVLEGLEPYLDWVRASSRGPHS